MGSVIRLLQAIANLTKSGAIKKLDDAYRLAQRELGDRFSQYQNQIKDAFDQGQKEITKITNKPTADIIPFRKKEGIESLSKGRVKKPGEVLDVSFKPGVDKRGKRVEESPSQASGTIMDRISKASNRIEELMKEQEAMYKPKQGLQLAEGLTRTIARKILDRKNIEIPKGRDPIGVFSDVFGESINDVNNLAEELIEIDQRGGGSKNIDEMIEMEGLFDIDVPKNPQKGMSDEEMLKIKKEVDEEKMLEDFDPTDRTENSMGGINRIGYADGPEDPKKKKGIMKAVKKIPKVGKLVGGLETIMNKFGTDAIGTLEDFYKKGKLKVDPNKAKYDEDRKAVFDFQMRQLNKTEADANKEMDAIIKDQIEGGFIRDMEKSMQRDMQRELKKPVREILDVPPVPEGFKLSKEKLMVKFPELDEAFADEMMNMDKDTAGRLIKMLENRRLDPEAYDRLLAEFGDTLQFQKEFDKYIRRKKNAEGGLQYLMGM